MTRAAASPNHAHKKAVTLNRAGGPEEMVLEDHVSMPVLDDDSVLVESSATSVKRIDWKIRSGARQKDFPLQLPAILGKDVAGVLSAVDANVRNFKPGRRVLAMANATHAEFVVVKASGLAHLPDGCDLVDSAALPLIAMTGDQLVRRAAPDHRREHGARHPAFDAGEISSC